MLAAGGLQRDLSLAAGGPLPVLGAAEPGAHCPDLLSSYCHSLHVGQAFTAPPLSPHQPLLDSWSPLLPINCPAVTPCSGPCRSHLLATLHLPTD